MNTASNTSNATFDGGEPESDSNRDLQEQIRSDRLQQQSQQNALNALDNYKGDKSSAIYQKAYAAWNAGDYSEVSNVLDQKSAGQ